jgi:hypothetical protein
MIPTVSKIPICHVRPSLISRLSPINCSKDQVALTMSSEVCLAEKWKTPCLPTSVYFINYCFHLFLQDHQAYIDTHDIKGHVEQVINEVVKSKPAQPLIHMVCFLR